MTNGKCIFSRDAKMLSIRVGSGGSGRGVTMRAVRQKGWRGVEAGGSDLRGYHPHALG